MGQNERVVRIRAAGSCDRRGSPCRRCDPGSLRRGAVRSADATVHPGGSLRSRRGVRADVDCALHSGGAGAEVLRSHTAATRQGARAPGAARAGAKVPHNPGRLSRPTAHPTRSPPAPTPPRVGFRILNALFIP